MELLPSPAQQQPSLVLGKRLGLTQGSVETKVGSRAWHIHTWPSWPAGASCVSPVFLGVSSSSSFPAGIPCLLARPLLAVFSFSFSPPGGSSLQAFSHKVGLERQSQEPRAQYLLVGTNVGSFYLPDAERLVRALAFASDSVEQWWVFGERAGGA